MGEKLLLGLMGIVALFSSIINSLARTYHWECRFRVWFKVLRYLCFFTSAIPNSHPRQVYLAFPRE